MQNNTSTFGLLELLRKTFMAIGIILFIALLSQTGAQAEDETAVRGTSNTRPGISKVVLFSR